MRQALLLLALATFAAPSLRADTLTGRLVDTDGIGIVNGDVDVFDRDSGTDLILTGDSTDANGFFNVTIPAGRYDLTFQGPPGGRYFEILIRDIDLAGTLDMGTLVLESGYQLSGRVLDESGFPVGNCDLDIFHSGSGAPVGTSGGRSDLFGNFSTLVPTDAQVHFDTRNVFGVTLAPRRVFYSIQADINVGDVTLRPGFTVSGTIRRPNGQLVVGADLDFIDSLGDEALTYNDSTDAFGNFSTIISADSWEILSCPPQNTTLAPLRLSDVVISGTTSLGTLTQPAGVLLFGTLTDVAGLRVPGADVDVIDASSGVSLPLCGDGSSMIGNYQVRVPAGTYHVLFSTPDLFGIRRDVVLSGQTRVDEVMVPCPRSSSTVRNGTGVNPVALVTTSKPRIARRWKVSLDCSGHAPGFGIVALSNMGHPGLATTAGEFLLSGAVLWVDSKPHIGNVLTFSTPVPPNVGLCGATGFGQGLILGDPGPRFTNAVDLVVGH